MLKYILFFIVMALMCCKGNSGNDGVNGLNGTNGIDGTNGKDGVDTTPVTVVKLCPGTPSYPSTFVEYAICLDGELYAVYSVPNSFLTLLTPGNYTSTGIGSSCNLTVGPNCKVTH